MNPYTVQLLIVIPQLRDLLDAREEVVSLRLIVVLVFRRQNLLLKRKQEVMFSGVPAWAGSSIAIRRRWSTCRRYRPPFRTAQRLVSGRDGMRFVLADAAAAEDASRTVNQVIKHWGRLDVLVNNAGAGAILPLEAATRQAIADIFAVNVFGPSLLATAALRI